eukprot:5861147-Pyramimonas_sp.AAC.1
MPTANHRRPCLLEEPVWPNAAARAWPSYRTTCSPSRCGNPSGGLLSRLGAVLGASWAVRR